MRLRSLIGLLLIVGIIGFLGFAWWTEQPWLVNSIENVRLTMNGYQYAKTPEDAMDNFAKAIKNRDYRAATLYVTEEYAGYLKKGNTAAYTIGDDIDRLVNLAKREGINTDKGLYVLRCMDPFPTDFKRRSSDKLVKTGDEKKERYIGRFVADPVNLQSDLSDITGLDVKLFRNAMMPPIPGHVPAFNYQVEIIPEGEGKNKIWKLKIPLDPITSAEIDHLVNNYKKYHNAFSHLNESARASGSYDSPQAWESDVLSTLAKQN